MTGKRVLVLRPEGQADELAGELSARGLEPVVVPAIRIVAPLDAGPVERALGNLRRFEWLVFTSVNGASGFFDRMGGGGTGAELPPRIAAVGPKTKQTLEERGVPVAWVPSRFTTQTLAAEFPGPPSKVCLIRAENAGTELEESLRSRGFEVERVDAYRSEPTNAGGIAAAIREGVGAIALTSASIADAFVGAAGTDPGGAVVCSIGPATSEECRRLGLPVDVEATEHTALGLAQAIWDHLDRPGNTRAGIGGGS